ncbi:hypothetical protein ABIE78_006245 [Sinorhizobium fredii]|jgi:hypothetical protein|uniref:Uncharacterized protein n=1 Tax=Sinorhizobium fredii (strain USDA 257) TaxID=1185652 RepID=I3XE17_SINF2|nr:hypothetical protein [Sinorhizobium fredii]AFL54123.1 hypothetical protein USDA257_c56080 [Sinorhizobium fredii USDA 257]
MSDTIEHYSDPQDARVALYLMDNDGDELTDILVAALEHAFRILGEDAQTMH